MDLKKVLIAVVYLAFSALLVRFAAGKWPGVVDQLGKVSPGTLALLAVTVLAGFGLGGVRTRIQMRIFGVRLKFVEWFGLTVCNSMFNYLPGRGGTALLAVYFKQRHGFPYARALLLAAVLLPLYFGISAGFAALLLLFRYLATGAWPGRLLAVLLLGAACAPAGLAAALLAGGLGSGGSPGRLKSWLRHFAEGAAVLRGNLPALALLGALYIGSLLVCTLRYWIIFRAFGLPVSFLTMGVAQTIVEFSTFVALTPGNLGVKEGWSVFAAGLLGLETTAMMAAALLDRAVNLAAVFGLGGVFAHLFLKVGRPPVTDPKASG